MQRCMVRHPLWTVPAKPLLGRIVSRLPSGAGACASRELAFTILPPPLLYGANRGKGRGASTTWSAREREVAGSGRQVRPHRSAQQAA